METQKQEPNQSLSVVCQKKQLSEIYKGGNNYNIEIIEEVSKLPNKSFFNLIHTSEKVKDLQSDQYFRGHLAVVLVKICALSGIKTEIDDFTKKDISNLICGFYKNLSVAEIWKAFELERYGVYETKTDHFQLFDSTYISSVLKKYVEWKQNEKRLLNWNPPNSETKELPELTETQKREFMTSAILRSFEFFKENGCLSDDVQIHVFDELVKRKFIVNSNNQKVLNYYLQHQERAIKELEEEYRKGVKIENIDRHRQALRDLEKGIGGDVNVRMKRNVLTEFFTKYKDDENFLEQLKSHKDKEIC